MNRSPPEDPIIAAALLVVDSLIHTLYSAKSLQDNNSLRTIGTLIDFEDQAANLAAAVRLFKTQRTPI
jgi:hypothetical protein